jgi:hypothetical protein
MPVVASLAEGPQVGEIVGATGFQGLDVVNYCRWFLADPARWFGGKHLGSGLLPLFAVVVAPRFTLAPSLLVLGSMVCA